MTNAVRRADAREQRKRSRISDTLQNFGIDILIFVAFIMDMNVRFTGIAIHEWLGIAFGVSLIVHLLLHWRWISAITQRFFRRVPLNDRINYLLNILLFVDFVVLVVTGLWISEVAMATLGLPVQRGFAWRILHTLSADISIWLIGLHLAFNWKWVANAAKRYLWQPIFARRQRTPVETAELEGAA
ncbi:MAG: DUF4405 domain-containing protein [Caldilineaceae bacterium]|nr:DUF4405 domain-containing protein [Caldilineaceae bacterium]